MPVGNSAGRGLNPRPERSTPAKYLLTFSLSAFRYRCSKSSSLPVVKESGPALPVGNNAGRGFHPRPERSTPAKYSPTLPNSSPPSPYKSSYFCPLSSALAWVDHSGRGYNPRPAQGRNAPPLLVAGVKPPTGTKSERSPFAGCVGYNPRPAQSRNAPPLLNTSPTPQTRQPPPRTPVGFCLMPVGNNAGRGLHPRPERSTPAKYPPTLPNSSPPLLPNPSHFPRLSNALAWVDHSGRGYNPRPAQSRNAPPLLVAGVKPPTGTKSERSPSAGCVGYNPRPAQSRNAPPLLVAWGTTPDRHKVGTLPLCWLRGVQPPTGTKSERSPSAGCGGYNPRPAQSRNAPPLLVAWGTTPDRHKVRNAPPLLVAEC